MTSLGTPPVSGLRTQFGIPEAGTVALLVAPLR